MGFDSMERRVFLGTMVSSTVAAAALGRLGSCRNQPETNVFSWTNLVDDRVWVTGGSTTGGTVMALRSQDQALMVDTKFAGLAPLLRSEAEERLGGAITHLINTHHHGDHTGGNASFGDCQRWCHTGAAYRIGQGFEGYKQQVEGASGMLDRLGDEATIDGAKAAFAPFSARAATLTREDWMPTQAINRYPMQLRLGSIDLVLYHFGPGHTDNDVVVHVPELNLIHCGDLLFNGLHPFFDPNGGTSAAGWVRSLKHAHALADEKTTIVAGHGPVGDRAALARQIRYVESLIESVRQAKHNGKTRDEIMAMSWTFMDGLERDALRPRAISAVYDELFPNE